MTVIVFLGAGLLPGISAQESSVQTAAQSEMNLPAQWDLQSCIDYALQQNITIRKNRVNAESTQIDVKTAKATLFPSLSFSTSQNMVNRPYQESSRTISGSEVIETTSKTSYNGNYGLNASWTIYNGSKRLNTIKQEKLNNQAANLDVETSENSIQESIAQIYIQILYAAESVKVNENTLQVSIAQRDRGQELLNAGKTIEDARKGGTSGCVETGAFGNEAYILTGYFNIPKVLELTLFNGYDHTSGKQLGPKTGYGYEFESYEELWNAFCTQMEYFLDIKIRGSLVIEKIYAEEMPVPFLSILTNDCISRGKDYNAGGARYNTSYIPGVGIW